MMDELTMDGIRHLLTNMFTGASIEAKVVQTLAAIVVFALLRAVATNLLQRGRQVQSQYQIRKMVGYAAYITGFVVVGRVWFAGIDSLTTYVGLLSAGLAISLQSPLVNLAGWFFILWRKPFTVGDRVQLGEHRGDVIDQRLFMFSLMEVGHWVEADQSTGRILHIPNGLLFTQVLANYSQGFQHIWHEVPVMITFESNWRKARSLLEGVAQRRGAALTVAAQEKVREAAKKFLIFYTHLTPIVYMTVRDSGVLLTIRYLCEVRRRRITEQEIWEDILDAFAAHVDIDWAYPTQRLYLNDREGKRGSGPEQILGTATLSAPLDAKPVRP